MMHTLLILLGFAISFFTPVVLIMAFVIGLAAGLVDQVRGAFWPAAKPTYIDPANRPRPMRAQHQFVGALVVAGVGILPIAMANWAPLPAHSPWRTFGFYLGGMAEGAAVGLL
ncbi:MAG: hypothetical protein ACREB1_00110, partial [Sphingomicrobium sp.]